jgi:uncharacterized protein
VTAAALPGLTVEVVPPPTEPTPLRSDVAGFAGATRRGPVGVAVRVDGLTDCQRRFGGLDPAAATTYALRGYFENGGQAAWVVRVSGSGPGQVAGALWAVSNLAGFPAAAYQVQATSPGAWANGAEVTVTYRAQSLAGPAEVDVRVAVPGEAVEVFRALPAAELAERLTASLLVRFMPTGAPAPSGPGPRAASVTLTLGGGGDVPPALPDWLGAVEALTDEPEVAIVATPGLDEDLHGDDRDTIVDALLDAAASQLDRLVVLDVPPDRTAADQAAGWADAMRGREASRRRAGAAYHPWLRVRDPLGGSAAPVRTLPPSGHVAGLISRLDRERGAHHTPANASLFDAVDLEPAFGDGEEIAVHQAGVNLLRCAPGRGLLVWGGRTLDSGETGRFVAHRRLLHRLVRAIRRVAEPLVFDVNNAELRLTIVRALTSVLLEAFRAGALRGARPEQGFAVRCDDTNNPPEQDPGLLVCDIDVAPAVPMEFIRLRLLVGQEGRLEVIEA